MAVVVPMVMAATGASAAIAGAIGVSAGVVTAATGAIVGASKLGKNINRAASKVFGEDVVKIANIAGSVALAAGWNPADTARSMFGGASSGASAGTGALAQAGSGAQAGMQAGVQAAGVAGGPTPVNGWVLEGPAPSIGTGGPAPVNGWTVQPPQPGAAAFTAGKPGVLAQARDWFNGMSPQAQGALVQVGGNVLAGAAQGYTQAQAMKEQQREQERRDRLFRSGSGVRDDYRPALPALPALPRLGG